MKKLLTRSKKWQIIRIMKKLPYILICLGLLFVSVNFAQKQIPKKSKSVSSAKKKTRPAPKKEVGFVCQLPASVNSIELSQSEVILNCPLDDNSCKSNKIIKVTTIAIDSGEMKYVYYVSAGKIIGAGSDVEWDLTDIKPGTYAITAGISQPYADGWSVFGETKTQIVTIKECPDCKE